MLIAGIAAPIVLRCVGVDIYKNTITRGPFALHIGVIPCSVPEDYGDPISRGSWLIFGVHRSLSSLAYD